MEIDICKKSNDENSKKKYILLYEFSFFINASFLIKKIKSIKIIIHKNLNNLS
jgi:hypothetical protein